MSTTTFKTYSAKPSDIKKKWVVVDVAGKPLGRVSSQIAAILKGKNKPEYTPHMDTGDNVIVVNAEKVALTGKKMTDRVHFRHTQYPGGTVFESPEERLKKDPTSLVYNAVKGMLPKNSLGRKMLSNLRVYAGPVHQHTAQNPEKIEL